MGSRKKKVAIVFGVADNYIDMLANALIGLKKHDKIFWDDIIVYYEDITEKHQKQLNKIFPCIFKKKSSEIMSDFSPGAQQTKCNIATFAKFECFKLLDNYEKIIYHDVDVLFQETQLDLLDYVNTDSIALVKSKDLRVEHNFFELIPEYNMFEPMYSSGLIVLSDRLKKHSEICSWCYRKIKEYNSKMKYCDQGILNLLIQEYQLKVNEIDSHRFQCHPLDEDYVKDATIIHSYGSRKFWNDEEYKKKFPEWIENYKEWKKIQFSSKDENPLVSVLMSTYNRYDFLKEAVESILNQTYSNLELIVVLEFCENQEKIEQILNSYHDKRIKIIKNKEKLGFPRSLNIGFDLAKGKYVARMDDDDISLPERLEKQVEFMEQNPDFGACGTRAEFFMYASGILEYIPTNPEEIKVKMLSFSTICHPSVMMRKKMFDQHNLRYDPNYFTEDYELWSRAIRYFKIANLDEVLLKYRISKHSLTDGSNEEKMHASHKKIAQNQCQQYLGIELTDNELELLQGRKEIVGNSVDIDGAFQIRNQLYKKIIIANQKNNFYDEQLLRTFFNMEETSLENTRHIDIMHSIKKGIKTILRPIYRPILNSFERKTYEVINQQRCMINDYNEELKNQILLEIKRQSTNNTHIQKALLINYASDNDNCGSSINNFVVQRYLNQGFMNVEYTAISQLKSLQDGVPKKSQFFDDGYMSSFIEANQGFINKIRNFDWIVINGEGRSFMYSQDTVNMLYLIHLVKFKFHKCVVLINDSIYRNNYVQNISTVEQEDYDKILTTVMNEIDYCTVQNYYSLINLSVLKLKSMILTFNCLPLYVDNYYNHFDLHLESDYIVFGIGNDIPGDYENIIYKIYQQTKKKIYILYWCGKNEAHDVKFPIFEKLSERIGSDVQLFKTSNIDESISLIDNAELLISEDCCYTIVSFMVNTPFIVLSNGNKEIETVIDMMEYRNRLVDSKDILGKVQELLKKSEKDNNQVKREELVGLAKNNFNFMNGE